MKIAPYETCINDYQWQMVRRFLPKRWVVERTFTWLIQNRRLVRDYEKSVQSAHALIYLTFIRLMLNQYS